MFDAVVERSVKGLDADFEFRIVTPRGNLKHLRATTRISDHVEGRPIFMGAVQDITDSKVAEEALRESENNARLMVDCIPGMVVAFSPDGTVEHANSQTVEYFGRTVEELNRWRFSELCHPDDLPRSIDLFSQSMATGEMFDYECRSRRHDGVYLWHRTLALLSETATGELFAGTTCSSTSTRESEPRKLAANEAELRRAYNSFRDAQRLIDSELRRLARRRSPLVGRGLRILV
jgi:PAS domain S-box-containing protein